MTTSSSINTTLDVLTYLIETYQDLEGEGKNPEDDSDIFDLYFFDEIHRSSTPSYDGQNLDSMDDQSAWEEKKAASNPRERESDCQMWSTNKNTKNGGPERCTLKVVESQGDHGKGSMKKVSVNESCTGNPCETQDTGHF